MFVLSKLDTQIMFLNSTYYNYYRFSFVVLFIYIPIPFYLCNIFSFLLSLVKKNCLPNCSFRYNIIITGMISLIASHIISQIYGLKEAGSGY